MARPLRLQITGGWYHLTARGNGGQAIFRQRRDYEAFTGLLGEVEDRFGLRIVCYALMPNHYHLLAVLQRPELSRAMQWLNLSHGAWFNAKHGQTGHLFQGRFHSVLVEAGGGWALEASAYIHLNPVRTAALGLDKQQRAAERAGMLPPPTPAQVEERLHTLRTYPWSSYRALAGLAARPPWLACEELVRRAGGVEAYCERIESLLRQGQPEPLRARLQMGLAFGSAAFAEKLRALATGRKLPGREHAARRALAAPPALPDIIRAVERVKGEKRARFENRHNDPGRDLIWWAARRFAGIPLATLAAAFGDVDYSTVSAAVTRLARRAAKDKALAGQMRRIEDDLSNPKI